MTVRVAVWILVAMLTAAVWVLAAVGARSLIVDEPGPEDCARGAISAIGPVDAQGRGDTTPEVKCLP